MGTKGILQMNDCLEEESKVFVNRLEKRKKFQVVSKYLSCMIVMLQLTETEKSEREFGLGDEKDSVLDMLSLRSPR